MKRLMCILILGLLVSPKVVFAASDSLDLNNYYYAHANMPGEYVLKDKYNNTLLKGDYSQNDGYVMQISFRNWNASGSNKVVVDLPDGSQKTVTNGETLVLPTKPKQVMLTLVKTDYTESFVEVSYFNVYDSSNGGVNLTYTFTGSPPTSFGDLGAGKPTSAPTATPSAAATPTPKPSATSAPTSTPAPTAQVGNLMAYDAGDKIVWNREPANTSIVNVYKNGVLLANVPQGVGNFYFSNPNNKDGTYEIVAISTQGNIIGRTELIINAGVSNPTPEPTNSGGGTGTSEPTPEPSTNPTDPEEICTAACQNIKDALECPELDEYLGKMANAIGKVIPPPPNWHNVADIMRDSIVPAMGQEIVNRTPEIAKIIADELESRESKVYPPPDLPAYNPTVPRFTDTPEAKGDINSGVPDFTPDFSESKPFIIADPMDVDLTDNTDKGYIHKEKPDNSAPVYQKTEKEGEPPPHYVQHVTWDDETREYKVEQVIVDDRSKTYDFGKKPIGSAAPDYQSNPGTPSSADYNFNEGDQIPEYGGE